VAAARAAHGDCDVSHYYVGMFGRWIEQKPPGLSYPVFTARYASNAAVRDSPRSTIGAG